MIKTTIDKCEIGSRLRLVLNDQARVWVKDSVLEDGRNKVHRLGDLSDSKTLDPNHVVYMTHDGNKKSSKALH